jgi:hypothetical protein
MLVLKTYPKSSSIYCMGFVESQILVFHISIFEAKTVAQKYMPWESCSSSYTEHKKVEFAIFGFFYDFIRFFKVVGKTHKRGRYILLEDPWNFLNFTNLPLPLAHRTPQE